MSIVRCISSPPFFLFFQFFFFNSLLRNYVPLYNFNSVILNKTIINEKKIFQVNKDKGLIVLQVFIISYTIHHGDSIL